MNTQLRPRLALLLASFSTVASGNATKIHIRRATVVPRLPTLPWPWSWSGHAHTLTWGTSQDGLDPTPVLDVLITKDVVYVQGELFNGEEYCTIVKWDCFAFGWCWGEPPSGDPDAVAAS